MLARFFGETNPYFLDELAIRIFSVFDPKTLAVTADAVCKDWRALVNSKPLQAAKETAHYHMQVYVRVFKEGAYFAASTPYDFTSSILKGGLTNKTLKIIMEDQAYVVRLSGENTGRFINRSHEEINAKIASDEGVNPIIYLFDKKKRIQVSQYLPSPVSMSIDSLKSPPYIQQTIALLNKVHQFKTRFANDVDVFERNRAFLTLIEKNNIKLPDLFGRVAAKMAEIEILCSSLALKTVPCHNDATPPNFIVSGGDMKLIDWEYSGNNFKEYDFAYWFIEAQYPLNQIASIYDTYLSDIDDLHYPLFVLSLLIAESWIALWGFVQIAVDNCSEDLVDPEAYAVERLQHCIEIMDSESFKKAFDQLQIENQPSVMQASIIPLSLFKPSATSLSARTCVTNDKDESLNLAL